jgi:hypothetical protein
MKSSLQRRLDKLARLAQADGKPPTVLFVPRGIPLDNWNVYAAEKGFTGGLMLPEKDDPAA